jgi:hypothetical protein
MMTEPEYRIKSIQEHVEPESADTVAESVLRLGYPPGQEPVLQSQALAFHRYVRLHISDIDQSNLKNPRETLKDMEGGLIDQIVLLASMCVSRGISCRIFRTSNDSDSRYTLEVLVENDNDVESLAIDAENQYKLRESKRRDGWYWTPADPMICESTGDLDELVQRKFIEKKTEGDTKYYDWISTSNQYTIWTYP